MVRSKDPVAMISSLWRRLVALGFRLLYYELAWTYDPVSWLVSLGHWRRWQLAALDFVSGPCLLEIGHGPGHILLELQRRGFQVTGLDLSPQMGRAAVRRLTQAGQHPAVSLVRGRVPALPFAAGSFDNILSQFPTPFITETETITALYRLLRPGGALVILPEGHLTGQGPLFRLISWLFKITGQSSGGAGANPAAVAALWSTWKTRLDQTGFSTRVEIVTLPGSACTVIIARRPEPETS